MAASDTCRWQLRRLGPSASCANVCDVMRLKNGNTRFGRSLDNDFYLDSKTHKNFISRHHAEIRYVKVNGKPQFVLYDHGLNGTFINDVRMEKSCVLKPGDKITFGHTNGFKIDPGQYSKQPNSEFQFTFEMIEDDSEESDSSSDDSGPDSDTTQPTNEHFCSRNLYNSPEYDRSQCWQQGQINKNNVQKSESELDNKDFTKNDNKVNPRSPRGKKGIDICANKDQLFKGDQKQNGNMKSEHLDPPVLKKQATLSYSDSGNDSSSGDSSDSDESTVPSEKSEENSTSESEHELTIDISVKTKASPRVKRTASANSKTRNAQTAQKKTNAKKSSPVKAKAKTKAARGRPTQKNNNKNKTQKDNSNNHNTISPSRRLLFNKKSTANGKNNSLKPDNLGDPYDFNSEEEVEEETSKGKNGNAKKVLPPSTITTTKASQNKNKKTTAKQTKTAGNTKRKKPQGNNKNKKAKTSTATDDSEEYGEEIWYYEGETCASESCLKPSDSTVEWVQCDDCDQWYHTMCVGAIYAAVKDTQMEFHCGC